MALGAGTENGEEENAAHREDTRTRPKYGTDPVSETSKTLINNGRDGEI